MIDLRHDGGPARIVYLGSPEIAVAPLEALVDAGHDVALVVTNPDSRQGRGRTLAPTPVKAAALQLGLEVTHDIDDVLDVGADFGVVVAYGHIIRDHILDVLPLLNIHFSLLPRWRGAAPLEWAILSGDETTGVCLMQIVAALDEGPVFARRDVSVGSSSLDELRTTLTQLSCELLVTELDRGLGAPEPQVGEPTHARKLNRDDHELDFGRTAVELDRVVRLGRAFTSVDERRLGVVAAHVAAEAGPGQPGELHGDRVSTVDGCLVLETVQPAGKKPMAFRDWINGARVPDGTRLGL